MPPAITTTKNIHRFDDPFKPEITVSDLGGDIGRLIFGDQHLSFGDQYSIIIGNDAPYTWHPKNRTMQEARVRVLEMFGPGWTTTAGVSVDVPNLGLTKVGADAFGTGAYTGDIAGNCGIEAKSVDAEKTTFISLQSGAVSYDFSAVNEIEHALVFGTSNKMSVWEMGEAKATADYTPGDSGLIIRDGTIVKYFLIKEATSEIILLRSVRSKLADDAIPVAGLYHGGSHLHQCLVWIGSEASVYVDVYGVLKYFQDWQNPASFESLAEKTMNKDKREEFTYFTDERNLMTLSINIGSGDEIEVYEEFLEFFKWHDIDTEFIYVDNARHHEYFVKFVSSFKDNPLGANLFGESVDVRQIINPPPIPSSPIEDTEAPTVPGAPSFSGVAQSSMTTNWTASADNIGVNGYELQRATNAGFTDDLQTFSLGNVLTHNETSLEHTTIYYFRVRSRDAAGNWSAYSGVASQATTAPDTEAPTGPVLSAITSGDISSNSIVLNWSASTDNVGVTGYQIQRALDAIFTSPTVTNVGNVLTNTQSSLLSEELYYFRVRARDAAANFSAWSNVENAETEEAPPTDAVFIIDGDSRVDQDFLGDGERIEDYTQPLLVGSAMVHNIGVGGGRLASGEGDFNLTASLESRLGSLFAGPETFKILYILSLYNDLMTGRTPAQYMTDLQAYITEGRSLGATHVIVGSPANSDYLGQNSDIHLNNLIVIDLLRTEFLDATPFGNADNHYLNTTSDNVIGIEADTTPGAGLYYTDGTEVDARLHFGEPYNVLLAPYLAEIVKRIVGTTLTPSIPSGLKVTVNGEDEIEITVDPACDGIAVTSRSYRLNEGSAVSMGTALTVTVGSLAVGSVQMVEVRATNGSGSSDWCPAKTVYTYPDFTGWTPASLSDEIHLKTPFQDAVGGTPADGLDEPIGAVNDESGVYDFTETTNKPLFKPDGISASLDSWFMNGTTSKLSHATLGNLLRNDFTVIAPFKVPNRGGGYDQSQAIIAWGDALSQQERALILYPYGGELVFSGGFYDMGMPGVNIRTGVFPADNTAKFVWARKTGSLVEIGVGKEKIVSGRPALLNFVSQIIRLGANPAGTQFLQGNLAESLVVPSSLSDLNLHYALNWVDTLVSEPPPAGLTNWSLTATATASTSYPGFPPSYANDDSRVGTTATDIWLTFTGGTQWLRQVFDAPRMVEEINLFSARDNPDDHSAPNQIETTGVGLTDFVVNLKIGGVWTEVADITGNNLFWKQMLITPVESEGIEVIITATPDGTKRIRELEAKG